MMIGSACRCALAAVTATSAVRLRSARNAARFLPLNIDDPPFVSLCRREDLGIELTREGGLAASLPSASAPCLLRLHRGALRREPGDPGADARCRCEVRGARGGLPRCHGD